MQSAVELLLGAELSGDPDSAISITSFRGAAKHARVGMDAQQYVDDFRKEWNHRR